MTPSPYPLRLRLRRGIDTHAATFTTTSRTACDQDTTGHHRMPADSPVTCPNCLTVLRLDR